MLMASLDITTLIAPFIRPNYWWHFWWKTDLVNGGDVDVIIVSHHLLCKFWQTTKFVLQLPTPIPCWIFDNNLAKLQISTFVTLIILITFVTSIVVARKFYSWITKLCCCWRCQNSKDFLITKFHGECQIKLTFFSESMRRSYIYMACLARPDA